MLLFNHEDKEFKFEVGTRVAQLVLEKIATPPVVEVSELDTTVRGEDGFGSTGLNLLKTSDSTVKTE